MEEYLIFAAIGGLLLLTLLVNSVSEAYEQNQREKRIRILKIKQGVDEISELLEQLNHCGLPEAIRELMLNEIMTRLQLIQRIDRRFRGIQALIDEASEDKPPAPEGKMDGFNVRDETVFKKKLIKLSRLIKLLNTDQWFSRTRPEQLRQLNRDAKLLRCEKIFQFYSNRANREIEQKNYLAAKEDYIYILHALKNSGIPANPRVIELTEQIEFMIQQVSDMFSNNARQMIDKEQAEEIEEEKVEAVSSAQEDEQANEAPAPEKAAVQ